MQELFCYKSLCASFYIIHCLSHSFAGWVSSAVECNWMKITCYSSACNAICWLKHTLSPCGTEKAMAQNICIMFRNIDVEIRIFVFGRYLKLNEHLLCYILLVYYCLLSFLFTSVKQLLFWIKILQPLHINKSPFDFSIFQGHGLLHLRSEFTIPVSEAARI